jgi:hypothetical protein
VASNATKEKNASVAEDSSDYIGSDVEGNSKVFHLNSLKLFSFIFKFSELFKNFKISQT